VSTIDRMGFFLYALMALVSGMYQKWPLVAGTGILTMALSVEIIVRHLRPAQPSSGKKKD
jgi:hypothetical protein